MRTTLFKAALTVGLFGVVTAAEAQQQTQGGVRTTGEFTQTFELRDNQNLNGSGLRFRSLTGFNFGLSSETQTSSISATSGISLRLGQGGFALARPKLNIGFGTDTKRVRYSGNLSFAKAPTAVNEEQPDLSILRIDTDRTVIAGNLGLSTKLNPTTNLSFGVNARRISYDPASASLVPSTDIGLTGKLTYRLNNRTSYGVNGGLGYFEADGGTNTTSFSADLAGQLNHDLTRTTSFDGNFGFSFIETDDTVGTATTSAFSVSLLYGAGLTQTLPDGSIGLSLNQTVNPSASGSLALGTRLSGSYQKDVNRNVSYSLGASLGRQEDIGGGAVTTFINLSPSYSHQLTRDVAATASYFVQRDDAGTTAHGLTVSFSRPFDLSVR